jgi:subtilisin family serine protease
LVVTAAKYGGTRASFAQQTSGVSVAAYGAATNSVSGGRQGILSTWIAGNGECGGGTPGGCRITLSGGNYAYLVGTSMAAPQVSGLVALMRAANPSLPAADVARLIKQTASHCGSYGSGIGWGVINAHGAVAGAVGGDVAAPSSRVKRAFARKLKLKRRDDAVPICGLPPTASGVKTVRILVAPKGSKDYRLVGKTKKKVWRFKRNHKKKKFRFVPKRGKRYRFYSVAIDEAGNREAAPAKSDEQLRVKRARR